MAYVQIRVGNSSAIVAQIKERVGTFKAKVGNTVQGAGIDMEARSKRYSPVDTGRLRAGNQYTKTGALSCSVGNAVSYAVPVNYGHVSRGHRRYVPPNGFFTIAAIETKQRFMEEIKSLTI